MRRIALALASTLVVLACSPNVGPDGLLIGGRCNDEFDCVTGAFCLRGADYPDGTCTTNCTDDSECRGASACVEVSAGACLLACEVDADCGREGYVCREETRRGAAGTVSVCTGG